MIYDFSTYLPMFSALFWAAILLLNKKKGDSAKTVLGNLMLMAFLLDLSMAVFYQQQYDIYAYFEPLNIFCSISIFLFFFWYIKLLTTEPTIELRNLWLFFPGLLFASIDIIIYLLMDETERMNYIHNYIFRYGEFQNVTPLIQLKLINFVATKVAFIATVVFSIIKSRILIKKYQNRISNYYSNLSHRSINWANNAIIGFIFLGIFSIIINTINRPYLLNTRIITIISSLFYSFILFIVGFMGYKQDFNISNLESFETPSFPEEISATPIIYKTREEQQVILDKLNQLFKEKKIHQKQDLKISDLASNLNTNRSYISRIINSEFNCSFIEYVNQYRIKDAKSLLKTDTTSSISDISLLSGFNTASTFTRVFRQYVGDSPSNFRKKHLVQKEEMKVTQ